MSAQKQSKKQSKPWHKKPWGIALLVLSVITLTFPIPLVIIMWQRNKLNMAARVIITVVVSLIYIPAIAAISDESSTQDNKPAESSQQNSEQQLTKDEILALRKQFKVEVLSYDSSQCFGEFPDCKDFVKLRITNNSDTTLPALTVLTTRTNDNGERIGSSRAPSIPTSNVKPGESLDYDYYPLGHLYLNPGYVIDVEIEHVIDPKSEKFFDELNKDSQ